MLFKKFQLSIFINIHFYVIKKVDAFIYDIGPRCGQKKFISSTQLKSMYEKCQHRIIYQHMNATCQM
jgi:hypothetical protein